MYRDSTMEVQIDEFDAFSMQGVFNLPYEDSTNWYFVVNLLANSHSSCANERQFSSNIKSYLKISR